MIKFFRKIRQNLLMENKTSKYLKYAIGEIILVVIGILIALQINNWNEERKEAVYERNILIDIQNSLQKDLNFWKILLNGRITRKESGAPELLKKLHNPDVYRDSVKSMLRDYVNLRTGINFSYDKGPYESLKSIGLDQIKNDSLRQNIVRMYEVNLPRGENFIDGDDDFLEQKIDDLAESFYEYKYSKDSAYKVNRMIKFDNMLNNPNFMKMLVIEQERAKSYRYRLEPLIDRAESLIEKIKTALEKT
jgi:hypothetical protein